MNGLLLFFFGCFSFFINVPESGEAHTTESTHTHPLPQTCVGEIQTSQLSEVLATCAGRGVWHVCASMTHCCCYCATFRRVQNSAIGGQQTAFTAVLTTADHNPFNSGPTAVDSASVRAATYCRWPANFCSSGSLAASTVASARQSSLDVAAACCCALSTPRFRSQTHFPPIRAPT